MSKEVLDKQVGEWRKEVARLKDLIAHATGTEAAANKAAEEGGLSMAKRIDVLQEAANFAWAYGDCEIANKLREIIAADRASRQVANKAHWNYCPECGSADAEEPRNGMGHFCNNCGQEWHADIDYTDVVQTNLARGAVAQHPASVLGKKLVANKAEVEPVAWMIEPTSVAHNGMKREVQFDRPIVLKSDFTVTPLYATHPATTGASTAEGYMVPVSTMLREIRGIAGSTRRGVGARVSDILDLVKTYESKLPVGASTVLTDERISEICDDYAQNAEYMTEFCRAIERAVVEQAVQVASVPSAVAAPDDLARDAALWNECLDLSHGLSNEHGEFVVVQLRMPDGVYKSTADYFKAAVSARLAAPSPAKESK